MKIPDSVTVNTGEQTLIYRTIDDFFDKIINQLEPKPLKRPTEFEIRHDNLQKFTITEVSSSYNPSDDFCHMLLYREKVVAIVLETRNNMNYIQFDFFYNPKSYLQGVLPRMQGSE
jgi:hypothetical protein